MVTVVQSLFLTIRIIEAAFFRGFKDLVEDFIIIMVGVGRWCCWFVRCCWIRLRKLSFFDGGNRLCLLFFGGFRVRIWGKGVRNLKFLGCVWYLYGFLYSFGTFCLDYLFTFSNSIHNISFFLINQLYLAFPFQISVTVH